MKMPKLQALQKKKKWLNSAKKIASLKLQLIALHGREQWQQELCRRVPREVLTPLAMIWVTPLLLTLELNTQELASRPHTKGSN